MGLIDMINAGAAKRMEPGQRYKIASIKMMFVDDTFNEGQKRPVVQILTPEGECYYCPSNIARNCADASPEEIQTLVGMIVECRTYYSNRLRRELMQGVIINPNA